MILYTQIDFAEEVKRLTDGRGVFAGLPTPFETVRDHSRAIVALPLFSRRATTEGDHTPDGL
jgi:hypothetical protein